MHANADNEADMVAMEKMAAQLKKVSKKLRRGQFEGEDLAAWTKLSIKLKKRRFSLYFKQRNRFARFENGYGWTG